MRKTYRSITDARAPILFCAAFTIGIVAVLLGEEALARRASVDTIVPTSNYSTTCSNGGSSVCRTDDQEVYYGWESSVPTGAARSNIDIVARDKYGTTDLNAHWVATNSIQTTGSTETDWVYRQGSVGEFIGYTYCDDASDGANYKCDQHYITIAAGYWNVALICHESGHAAGLLHGINAAPTLSKTDPSLACMKTPNTTDDTNIGSLNKDNLNEVY